MPKTWIIIVHVSETTMKPSIKILYNSANAAILGAVDINKAAEQVELVFNTHNTKLYIERHKPILHKYSISNPYNQEWVRNKLSNA